MKKIKKIFHYFWFPLKSIILNFIHIFINKLHQYNWEHEEFRDSLSRYEMENNPCLWSTLYATRKEYCARQYTISPKHKNDMNFGNSLINQGVYALLLYTYRLVGFSTTLITGVSGHLHHRFNFSASCYNTTNHHQLPHVKSLDIPNSHGFLGWWSLKIYLTGKKINHKWK